MDARRHLLVQRRGWDRAAGCYARYWQRQLAPAHALTIQTADLAAGERVLDVACGTGELTMRVAAAVSPAGRVVATDLSPNMTSATLAAAAAVGADNVEVTCCEAERLSVDGAFDVALCSLGLMYTPQPAIALAELHRVVRPGGRVVLSVWGDRRNCGWAPVFGIVDACVTSDVCPHFFALGAPGLLTGALRDAGFVGACEQRLRVSLDYRDADEAVGAVFLGGPVALAYGRFGSEIREQVVEEYLAAIEPFRTADDGYALPGEFVVASARRPEELRPSPRSRPRRTPMTLTDQPVDKPVDNGVDTAALLGARQALTEQPAAAHFTWRASCAWVHGTHSTSTVDGFRGLGQEMTHRTTYRFEADHPECFASQDLGATPVEYVLVGLAGCLTAGVAAVAQHRDVQLRSVTATIEGHMNVLGILGADPEVRNGFDGVRIRFDIDADASRADLEAIVAQSQRRSAVFDIVTNPTDVVVELA